MPKQKTNKGLMKRIRITKSGKIKMGRAFGRHLRSHKSGDTLRSYRKAKYAQSCDAKRLQPILPRKVRGATSEEHLPDHVDPNTVDE